MLHMQRSKRQSETAFICIFLFQNVFSLTAPNNLGESYKCTRSWKLCGERLSTCTENFRFTLKCSVCYEFWVFAYGRCCHQLKPALFSRFVVCEHWFQFPTKISVGEWVKMVGKLSMFVLIIAELTPRLNSKVSRVYPICIPLSASW